MSRRLLPIILTAAALMVLFSGCQGCMEPPPTPHKATMERIAEEESLIQKMTLPPRKGAIPSPAGVDSTVELVVALPTLPNHLNPFLEIDEWGYHIAMHHIYEGLLDRDPKTGRLVGALAESWSSDEKGSAYRFRLRSGVRWQDGRPFTVEDVVFTFNMLTMPKIDRGPFISDIDYAITRVDKFGPDEVRIVLREPNIYFLDHLVELPILPSHVFFKGVSPKARGSLSPVGTGPYRLLQWEGTDELVLEKNEYYWGSSPDVGRVIFRRFPDAARSFVGIRRKQVHVLPRVTPAHYPDQITETVARDYELVRFVPPQFSYLLWNVANPMLADFRIRRALSMLIDRDRIIEKVFRGLATPCTGPFWQPGGLGDAKQINWPFDPPAARELLTQVDWVDHDGDGIRDKGGVPLRLVVLVPVAARQGTEMLQILKSDFQKAGVDLVIVPTDWNLMGANLRKRQFSAALLSWAGRPYEDFSPLFHSTGRYNYGVVYNTMIDQLLVSMRKTTRLESRFDFSVKLENMLHAYLPMTFLVRPVWIGLVHRDFTNAIPTPHGFRYSQFKYAPRHTKESVPKKSSETIPPAPSPTVEPPK